MKAAHYRKYGGPEVIEFTEITKPQPKDDEILVKIKATAVTNSDLFMRSSKMKFPTVVFLRLAMGIFRPRAKIAGIVYSGVIEEAGKNIKSFKAGDEVFGMTGYSLGTYAEYKCLKEQDSPSFGCIRQKPRNISHEEATAVVYGGLLGFQAVEKFPVKEGQKVLIYGGSSTSGTMAVQYAKNLGAEVTAVSSAKNKDLLMSLGADKHLDYTDSESINKLEKYDLLVDTVGKYKTSDFRSAAEKSLAPGGHLSSIDDGAMLLDSERLERILKLVEQGVVHPVLDSIYPFSELRKAHEHVETGHKVGGIAVTVD